MGCFVSTPRHRSLRSTLPVHLEVRNATPHPISLDWWNYEAQRQSFAHIPPGESCEVVTDPTHAWSFSALGPPDGYGGHHAFCGKPPVLVCASSRQSVVYPCVPYQMTAGELDGLPPLPQRQQVRVVEARSIRWAPRSHAAHFQAYRDVVRTVLLCHHRPAAAGQEPCAPAAALSCLPAELLERILALVVPDVPDVVKPAVPEAAQLDDFSRRELYALFRQASGPVEARAMVGCDFDRLAHTVAA